MTSGGAERGLTLEGFLLLKKNVLLIEHGRRESVWAVLCTFGESWPCSGAPCGALMVMAVC
jgi:hypothetical protein